MRSRLWPLVMIVALLALNYARYDSYYASATAQRGDDVMATGFTFIADGLICIPLVFLAVAIARRVFPSSPARRIMQIVLPVLTCWPAAALLLTLAIAPFQH